MVTCYITKYLFFFSIIAGFTFAQDCASGVADVVFVVDDSTSVQKSNFEVVLKFVATIVNNLVVGPDAVQVSFLSFSRTVRSQFYLNAYTDTASVVQKIVAIRFRGGGTDIAAALNYAYTNNFAASRGARENVEKVLVLITDGVSDGAEPIAKTIREAGMKVLCVGITDSVNITLLEVIAGSRSNVYYVEDFSSLDTIQDLLVTATCQATNEAAADPCDGQPCLNDGTCISNGTEFRCGCKSSFTGNICEIDINECLRNASLCEQNCTNTYGGYNCNCKSGYSLNIDLHTCDDTDECAEQVHDCSQLCNNAIGSFGCDCQAGYTLNADGKSCDDETILSRLKNEIKTSMSTVMGNWTSDRAVDGDNAPNPDTCQCCSGTTNAHLSWWMVDFGQIIPIKGISIYSRNNEKDYRQLVGFQVVLSDRVVYNTSSVLYRRSGDFSRIYEMNFPDVLTRFIKIQRPGVLTLCEVEVFQGVCKIGRFGRECEQACHCADNTQCDQITEYCQIPACKTGWQGLACNETCPLDTFGDNCSDSCYCAEGTCTNNYGICPGECRQGYHGPHCNQVGSEMKSKTALIWVAVGSAAALLIIGVIIGISVLHVRRKRRASRKSEYETPNLYVTPTEIQEYDTIEHINGSES